MMPMFAFVPIGSRLRDCIIVCAPSAAEAEKSLSEDAFRRFVSFSMYEVDSSPTFSSSFRFLKHVKNPYKKTYKKIIESLSSREASPSETRIPRTM